METTAPIKLLFLAAEVAPFAKAGGLADVTGALPKALAARGADVRIVMPKYGSIDVARYDIADTQLRLTVRFDSLDHIVRVYQGSLPGTTIPVYFLDHPHYEGAGDVYYQDVTNASEQRVLQTERFLFFCVAALDMLQAISWQPDVLHCHDWHTALVPALVWARAAQKQTPSPATVYTIHNLALQGNVSVGRLSALLGFPLKLPRQSGHVNIAEVGLCTADMITTVSPTYAQEIVQKEFGCGLDGVLRERKNNLVGILNGIDVGVYDPGADPFIARRYSLSRLDDKDTNTKALRQELGLHTAGPILGLVSRLTEQKGIDLVCAIIPNLVHWGCGVVILGSGEPSLEKQCMEQARAFPKSVAVKIGFDAALAQKIYAGSDCFLMPSKYEPCGLGQMIAMRYGTIPVVRAIGGLRDTVTESAAGTGFVFRQYAADDLLAACRRALNTHHDRTSWRGIQVRAMQKDFSWKASAPSYEHVYALARAHHDQQRAS